MKKLDKLNKLVFEYQCQLAEAEASGKDFEKISKLLNDTTKERKDYIAELVNRDEPMTVLQSDINYCPNCGERLFDDTEQNYCDVCGQKLDWSNKNE